MTPIQESLSIYSQLQTFGKEGDKDNRREEHWRDMKKRRFDDRWSENKIQQERRVLDERRRLEEQRLAGEEERKAQEEKERKQRQQRENLATVIAKAAKAAAEDEAAAASAAAAAKAEAEAKAAARAAKRKERAEKKSSMTPQEKEALKEKRLLKLIGAVVVKCMSKYAKSLDRENFKKYAREVCYVFALKIPSPTLLCADLRICSFFLPAYTSHCRKGEEVV